MTKFIIKISTLITILIISGCSNRYPYVSSLGDDQFVASSRMYGAEHEEGIKYLTTEADYYCGVHKLVLIKTLVRDDDFEVYFTCEFDK